MQALERTSKLADQMLAYSRAQNAADKRPRMPVDLRAVVRDAVMQLEPVRVRKSQRVSVKADGADDTRIMADPTKIQRLVLNLLDNASRYAPEHSTIEVGLAKEGGLVTLPFPMTVRRFPSTCESGYSSRTTGVPGSGSEGSGLGLAIVKEVAAQHGASISLDSLDESSGTVLTVSFHALEAGLKKSCRTHRRRMVFSPSERR